MDDPTEPPHKQSKLPFRLERGIAALQALADGLRESADAALKAELLTQVARLTENQRSQRLFGDTPTLSSERFQIIHGLNAQLLQGWKVSFNDLCQGVLPQARQGATADSSALPGARPHDAGRPDGQERHERPRPLRLQLSLRDEGSYEVRTIDSPLGEPPSQVVALPYSPADLVAVVKALDERVLGAMFGPTEPAFTPGQIAALERLGLVLEGDFAPDLLDRVGQQLFSSLFQGDVKTALRMAQQEARVARASAAVQLRFDQEDVLLSRYPWELLHDGQRPLLPSRAVELTRYITYGEPAPRFAPPRPLEVLYVASSPASLASLPLGRERALIREALAELERAGAVKVVELPEPTYAALLDYQQRSEAHVLHFDGHGTFGRMCPRCHAISHAHLEQCAAPGCFGKLKHVKPQGFLAFQQAGAAVDWVPAGNLSTLFYGTSIQLAVLSACSSATVRGESIFSGVAPALIQAGVPAVVASQQAITADASAEFTRGFYSALGAGKSLPAAVNQGRQRLARGSEWFIPVLYLRSSTEHAYV